jgi:hypothetical protein
MMKNTATTPGQEIDKRHVAATVLFAINNVPRADKATLEKFLELVNECYGQLWCNQPAAIDP